ncbi:Hint domain-containing protein [Jannaschia sp. S6380]|uniref:Hint domain-containing protein n=1 Tax=Jannaschia sp. S6380 TaxID=2926408 RepID=UPI001FF55EE7|nr:Hint domain-containing protein [Jannaschia sp. S6380]MCK0166332.1 Hint domain-containing protein [Jannaschia sp. S6380]
MTKPTLFSRPAFPVETVEESPTARFVPGTLLPTPDGPRAVEDLAFGDRVVTRDGPRPIAKTDRTSCPRSEWTYRRETWPVRVPVGSLGNPRPLRLAPDQRVLLSGPTVARICAKPEVAIVISDLVGLRGLIVERPLADLRYHVISFGTPVCVEAEGVPCDVGGRAKAVDRDKVREAYQAMHSAGEPPLRLDAN